MHKIGQSGGFLGRRLGLLLKTGLPLIENVLKLLTESVNISIGLTTAAAAVDAAIHKKMFGSGATNLTISNEEMNYNLLISMNDIMKIIQSLEESGLLMKELSKTIKNEPEEQKCRFLCMLLHTLGASLLGDLLTDKGTIRACKRTVKAGRDF